MRSRRSKAWHRRKRERAAVEEAARRLASSSPFAFFPLSDDELKRIRFIPPAKGKSLLMMHHRHKKATP